MWFITEISWLECLLGSQPWWILHFFYLSLLASPFSSSFVLHLYCQSLMAKLSSLKIKTGQLQYEKQRKEHKLMAMKVCFSQGDCFACCMIMVLTSPFGSSSVFFFFLFIFVDYSWNLDCWRSPRFCCCFESSVLGKIAWIYIYFFTNIEITCVMNCFEKKKAKYSQKYHFLQSVPVFQTTGML